MLATFTPFSSRACVMSKSAGSNGALAAVSAGDASTSDAKSVNWSRIQALPKCIFIPCLFSNLFSPRI